MTRSTKEKGERARNQNQLEQTVKVGLESFPEKPISVQVETINKSNKGISITSLVFAILGTISFIVGLVIYLNYVFPTNTPVVENISSYLNVIYVSPVYISEGDQNTINVSIVNLHPDQPFSGTVTLNFSDPTVPIMPVSEKSLSIIIKDLQPRNRITGQYKFMLPLGSSAENVEYFLQINTPDGVPYTNPDGTPFITKNGTFLVTYYPYTRTIYNWLIRGGGIGAILATLGSIRKMFGIE